MIFVNDAKYVHFFLFELPPTLSHWTIHKINRILLISLQILTKTSVSNIINDLSYNLNKYIFYKHVWKLFEVGRLHQHTVTALYRLNRNRKLLKFLRILITAVYFKDRKWISKTLNCISCSMAYKLSFCSEFPDIRIRLAQSQEQEGQRQFQSVIHKVRSIIIQQCLFLNLYQGISSGVYVSTQLARSVWSPWAIFPVGIQKNSYYRIYYPGMLKCAQQQLDCLNSHEIRLGKRRR